MITPGTGGKDSIIHCLELLHMMVSHIVYFLYFITFQPLNFLYSFPFLTIEFLPLGQYATVIKSKVLKLNI